MIYLYDPDLVLTQNKQLGEKDLRETNLRHVKALRPEVGEEICFLNFAGRGAQYRVAAARPITLEWIRERNEPESKKRTHLYLAAPLGPALDQAVEQATEVGYDTIVVLRTDHGQYPKNKELNHARLKRIVEASTLQCGRFWAPAVDPNWQDLASALHTAGGDLCLYADEGEAKEKWGPVRGPLPRPRESLAIFVGPEGGWSVAERKRLGETGHALSLGPHILRVPTAVVAAYVLVWKEIAVE